MGSLKRRAARFESGQLKVNKQQIWERAHKQLIETDVGSSDVMPEGRSRGYAGNLLHEAHTAILMREHGMRRTRFAADNVPRQAIGSWVLDAKGHST
jgi:hypothetical protein